MKIRIEIDENSIEDEVIIRCSKLSDHIQAVQRAVSEITAGRQKFVFYKGETEYYLSLDDVLFFETDEKTINVHTSDNVYLTKYKLYELEDVLPNNFMRISKSAILNVNSIYSLTRSISACTVQFSNSHKQVYVSRYYYKPLKAKLEEKRIRG